MFSSGGPPVAFAADVAVAPDNVCAEVVAEVDTRRREAPSAVALRGVVGYKVRRFEETILGDVAVLHNGCVCEHDRV